MRYRRLGKTDLKVSILSYGVYSITGMYGNVSKSDAVKILKRCYEEGINFFDTADMYGKGYGEEILFEAFKEDINDIVIATKIGYDFYNSERPVRRFDPEYLRYALDKSLERLKRSYVDLLYIHNPSIEVLKRYDVWELLEEFKEEGKALYTGVALGPEVNILEHAKLSMTRENTDVVQFVFNMLEEYPGRIVSEIAKEKGVGVVVRVPHAGGVLDETIKPGFEKKISDHRSLRRRGWYEWAFKVYNLMKPYLDDLPGTPGQKALKFIEQSIEPDSIVLIANSIERLDDYLGYLSIPDIPRNVIDKLVSIHDTYLRENPEIIL